VVGKEYVRAMVAFLTNDFAVVRARGRLFIIGADVQYRPDTQDRQRSATIRRQALYAFWRATAAEPWHPTVRSVAPLSVRARVGDGRAVLVDETKTAGSARALDLPDRAEDIVSRQRKEQLAERVAARR
jgi:hypothetical protein